MAKRPTEKAPDSDAGKGAVEQDRPEQETNMAPLDAQLDHQFQDPLNKSSDSDFPEPGQNPEYSMEKQDRNQLDRDTESTTGSRRDPDGNAEGELNDQDPGHRQKQNQNEQGDDPLAA
ncbi:MAG TPA: hypothetical protein VEG32_10530 [Clostridia bacterium]|nr:hypothetical protein [Clostridia bacterium]